MNGKSTAIGRKGHAGHAGCVAHATIRDRTDTSGREQRLGHAVAENAFVAGPRTHRLDHPDHWYLHRADFLDLTPKTIGVGRASGGAGIHLAGNRHAHRRTQPGGHGLDFSRHVILMSRNGINITNGVGQQRGVEISQLLNGCI